MYYASDTSVLLCNMLGMLRKWEKSQWPKEENKILSLPLTLFHDFPILNCYIFLQMFAGDVILSINGKSMEDVHHKDLVQFHQTSRRYHEVRKLVYVCLKSLSKKCTIYAKREFLQEFEKW